MTRAALLLLLPVLACGASVRETKTEAGETVYEAQCEGDGSKCHSAAKEQCPEGVGVVSESESTTGPHLMTFRCQRNGDPFAAKPASSPSSGTAGKVLTVLGDGAKGFSDGVRSSETEGCRSSSSCGTGYVCMIPKGERAGTCMKPVD